MPQNKRGQMALVMILIIAMGLVLMGLVMNWNRAVQLKTQAQIATTVAAASMVAHIASFGENLMQTHLEGKRQKCDQNGILGMIILLIILIIITILCWGTCAAATFAIGAGAIAGATAIAATLMVVAIAVQVAYIQPTMSRVWNRMQNSLKTPQDQYLETGLQTAMGTAMTDTETIPDFLDYNANGKWNVPGVAGSDSSERVARFSYYYTERLKSVKPLINDNYELFRQEMLEFISDIGLDPGAGCSSAGNNRCNPLCVYHPPVNGVDMNEVCEKSRTPFMDYPLSYDPLMAVTIDDTYIPGGSMNLVQILGTDRVLDVTGLPLQSDLSMPDAASERGPLFHMLWYLKEAVRKNDLRVNVRERTGYVAVPQGTNYGIFDGSRQSLMFFYEPEAPMDCPLADPELLYAALPAQGLNLWRPGDNRFCQSHRDPATGVVSAPHSANCFDRCSSDDTALCMCTPDLVNNQGTSRRWQDDTFDADLNVLRDLRMIVAGVHLDRLSKEEAIKAKEDESFVREFHAMWGEAAKVGHPELVNGTLHRLERDLARTFEAIDMSGIGTDSGFQLTPMGTFDIGQEELNKAAGCAKMIVKDFQSAFTKAFGCEGAFHPELCDQDAQYDPNGKLIRPGGKNRIDYIRSLFDQSWGGSDDDRPAISRMMIYGWQSKLKDGNPGSLHMIKVEGDLPKRCSAGMDCGAKKFPWVKTEKKGMFKRCYVLKSPSGCVRMRVLRWDQPADALSKTVNFVGGLPLWHVMSANPSAGSNANKVNLTHCFMNDEVHVAGKTERVPGAFMVNRESEFTGEDAKNGAPAKPPKFSQDCRLAVEAAIAQSNGTEVCAKYYLDPPTADEAKYKMKFVPCDQAACLTEEESKEAQ
jgi:hypothetical protein